MDSDKQNMSDEERARMIRETPGHTFEDQQAQLRGEDVVNPEGSEEHYDSRNNKIQKDERLGYRDMKDRDADTLLDESEITGKPDEVSVSSKEDLYGADNLDNPDNRTYYNEEPLEHAKDKDYGIESPHRIS
jgi:hypothetical protein